MQISVFLHKGDGHLAEVQRSGQSLWLNVRDKQDNELAIFIPESARMGAQAFAESINDFCATEQEVEAV